MTIFFSPSTGGFYDDDVHAGRFPDDANAISPELYHELMAGNANGRAIVVVGGMAELAPAVPWSIAIGRSLAIKAVKDEARRRILAIASLAQQSNDNAALAVAGLAGALSEQAAAALERRQRIDAVRDIAKRVEGRVEWMSAAELDMFSPAAAFEGAAFDAANSGDAAS